MLSVCDRQFVCEGFTCGIPFRDEELMPGGRLQALADLNPDLGLENHRQPVGGVGSGEVGRGAARSRSWLALERTIRG
jgi:hypothetical protein